MGSDFDDVIAGARSGEGWAFDALFRQWNGPVTGFVRARGVADPDDVVNEVFLGAFTSISRFRGGEADFRAWIFRIARNKIADDYRRSSRRVETAPLIDTAENLVTGDVEIEVEKRLARSEVERLLATLTDDQQEVLLLRLVGDLTVAQIAEITGRRRGAIKQLQRRGLRRVEAQLTETSRGSAADPYPSEQ